MDGHDGAVISEALGIAELAGSIGAGAAILLAHSEAQAARLAGAARALAGGLNPVHVPAWDCVPFDRASPSHAVMGRRMAALREVLAGSTRLVIASAEASTQRLPRPRSVETLALRSGDVVSGEEVATGLARLGFVAADEAEAPGEVAVHPAVIDVFPADGGTPVRIRFDGDRVSGLERIDAVSRRGRGSLETVTFGPATERLPSDGESDPTGMAGGEEAFDTNGHALASVFDLMPDAALLVDEDADASLRVHLAAVADAREARIVLARSGRGTMPPEGLTLAVEDWERLLATRSTTTIRWPLAMPVPRPSGDPSRMSRLLADTARAGRRIALSGRRLAEALELDAAPVAATDYATVRTMPPGTIARLPGGLVSGFADDACLVLAADDVLAPAAGPSDVASLFTVPLTPGDTVIHLDHGLARLSGLETIDTEHGPIDCLALDFAGDARKLVPCSEMDRVWRHGGPDGTATPDRADGSSWAMRCGGVVRDIEATAERMVAEAKARRAERAAVIRPDRRAMTRFVAGFPFAPTRDQLAAFDAIADDLASGTPMHRLLCGEAGFGKTEAALRAAAAAALAGHQVAVLAPTTVLVRQHAETFRRRFAAIGLEPAALSRLTPRAAALRIRKRLADRSLPVVIGTQSLAGADMSFRDLALVIVDEEQRFGTEDKQSLAGLTRGVHALMMTATPIPRTLERALAGLEAISILATPPARRLPVRTVVVDRDEALIAPALRHEHASGGQSFAICPRIKDLDAVAALLRRLVPELSVVTLHGRMKPDALDAALVGFAEGHGDVLLATNIIEAGLDMPRANTLLAFDADRFGLAQLHQIRGRVGRGSRRGHAYLFRSSARSSGRRTGARLEALAKHDGLGAGFAIAAQDLDQRGGGDLLGDEQVGHAGLLGLELARHLTGQAIRRARGEAVPDDWRPETSLSIPFSVPADYVGDEMARLALHARLGRPHRVRELAAELEDRFGPIPETMRLTLAAAEIHHTCRRVGVARLEIGPVSGAAELHEDDGGAVEGRERKGRRLLLRRPTASAEEGVGAARHILRLLSRRAQGEGDDHPARTSREEPPRKPKKRSARPPVAEPA